MPGRISWWAFSVALSLCGCRAGNPVVGDPLAGDPPRASAPEAGVVATLDSGSLGAPDGSSPPPVAPPDAGSDPVRTPDAATLRDASGDGPVASDDAGPLDAGTPVEALARLSAPELLGVLVGPQADSRPLGATVYGTDLGFPIVHDDQLVLLFGDTAERASDVCIDAGNDDAVGYLPLTFDGRVPDLRIEARPEDPTRFSPIRLMAGETSLPLTLGRVPVGGFVRDGRLYAWFNRLLLERCVADGDGPRCPVPGGFECTTGVGTCAPARSIVTPPLCDVATGAGCAILQTCMPAEDAFCFDRTSSPHDGTVAGQIAAAVHTLELGVQDPTDPTRFERVAALSTNKFWNPAVRGVAAFSGTRAGNDYRSGEGAILMWGRPAFIAGVGGGAGLYLAVQHLPLPAAAPSKGKDQVALSLSYFSGIDPRSGEPTWSEDQREAAPIALDGQPGGDTREPLMIVNQMSLSWLGPPIEQWMMVYGGGVSTRLVDAATDPNGDPSADATAGAVMARFGKHPWGPFSPPQVMLSPGVPTEPGLGHGPGGTLYHASCVDTRDAMCAPADGDFGPGLCLRSLTLWDPGCFYAAIVLDPYTAPNRDGGLDVIWTVSTWNPYHIVMLRTAVHPER